MKSQGIINIISIFPLYTLNIYSKQDNREVKYYAKSKINLLVWPGLRKNNYIQIERAWRRHTVSGQNSKPRGSRLLTVTGSQISPWVPCHLQPSSKPRKQAEIENWQCDIGCVCVSECLWYRLGIELHGPKNRQRQKQKEHWRMDFKHCHIVLFFR